MDEENVRTINLLNILIIVGICLLNAGIGYILGKNLQAKVTRRTEIQYKDQINAMKADFEQKRKDWVDEVEKLTAENTALKTELDKEKKIKEEAIEALKKIKNPPPPITQPSPIPAPTEKKTTRIWKDEKGIPHIEN